MQIETLKIKPRAPQQRAIEKAQKDGNPVPIAREPFELQIPSYDRSDIVTLVEQANHKVLDWLARLVNSEIITSLRSQLADDEQFPVDQEIDTTNFDMDAIAIDKLAEQTTKSNALELEFTDEQFQEFVQDFVATMLPQYQSVPKAEFKLLNIANVLVGGFKDIRNEQDKMDKVKATLDKFATESSDDILEKYSDMYEYFAAMYNKRSKALAKRNEKTDVFLD